MEEKEGRNYKLPDRINWPSSPKKQYSKINVKLWWNQQRRLGTEIQEHSVVMLESLLLHMPSLLATRDLLYKLGFHSGKISWKELKSCGYHQSPDGSPISLSNHPTKALSSTRSLNTQTWRSHFSISDCLRVNWASPPKPHPLWTALFLDL